MFAPPPEQHIEAFRSARRGASGETGVRTARLPAWGPAAVGRLRSVVDAARRRDWMALAERLTWTGLAGLAGFGAGVVVGLLATASSMGPGWVAHPVLAAASLLRRLPVPGAFSALAVLAAGFALIRLPACARLLLILARVAVGVLAVAVAYRLIAG